ncbi:MAG: DNA polymerase I, partial [Bacillota bacterium]
GGPEHAGPGRDAAADRALPEVEELAGGEAVARWLGERGRAGGGDPAAEGEPVSVVAAVDEPAGAGPRLAGVGLATAGRAAAWVRAAGAAAGDAPGRLAEGDEPAGQDGTAARRARAGDGPGARGEPGPDEAALLAALARRPLAGFDLKPLYRVLAAAGQSPAGSRDARQEGRGRPGPLEPLPAPAGDVKLAAYLLDPVRNRYHLVDLARQFLGMEVEEGPADRPADPACRVPALLGRDAALCARLRPAVEAEIAARGLERVYREIELPLVPVLAAMELAGIAVDREQLERLGRQFAERSEELAQRIYELAGETFNINSTQQLGQILFERLKLPVVKKTKTGYSTDAEVLEALAAEHPIAELVLEYRSLAKLRGTYVEGLAEHIGPDGRIHTTFQQTVAATGRLSSTQPNLQNIPIRDEPGRSLRRAFVAAPGHRLVAADYSQIELRVLAHYSGDRALHEAFAQGQDVHARTASEIFGVPLEQVTPEQRRVAKAVNFGLAYGQTDFGLARALRIDRAEARRFMERYFERYPGVKRYMEETIRRARETGE